MGFAAVRLETGKQSSRAGRLHCQGEWSRQPQSFRLFGSVHPRPGRISDRLSRTTGEECAKLWFTVLRGGAGTLDERFDGKPRDFPIILMGKGHRKPLMDFALKMADEGHLDPMP
jgi:hypothetical protein